MNNYSVKFDAADLLETQKRNFRLIILALVAVSMPLLAGCVSIPSSKSLVQEALTVEDARTVVIRVDDVAPAGADRFTINCPYELVEKVSERLSVASTEVPDYSLDEGRNAIIFVTGSHVVESVEFDVRDVNLCHDSSQFGQVHAIRGELVFERSDDSTWVLAQTPQPIEK